MAVGDVYRLSVEARLAGQTIVNVFHYQVFADPTLSASAQSLINGFSAAVIPSWIAATHDLYTFVLQRCIRVVPAGPAAIIQDFAPNTTGSRTTTGVEPLPPNVSCAAIKRTALAGRWARGRVAFAGALAEDVTLGLWENAYLTLVDALSDNLEELIVSGEESYQPIVFSETRDGVPVLTKTPITTVTVQPQVRVQRSRTVGVGI